jgi:hypothetical protein
MQVKDFGKLCPDSTVRILKNSINKINITKNYWFSFDDLPQNNIEKFILETFNILFPEIDKDEILGFEWWFHNTKTIKEVQPHFDCDEYKRSNQNIIVPPLGCSVTYLTDSLLSPTIITNIKSDNKEYKSILPTEMVYSFPGVGKTITFGPLYLHGIKNYPNDLDKERLTLLYNVWNYKPNGIDRSLLVEDIEDLEISPNTFTSPITFNGESKIFYYKLFEKILLLKFPIDYQLYDTYKIHL